MRKTALLLMVIIVITAVSAGLANAWWCSWDGFAYPGGPAHMMGGTPAFSTDPQGRALAAKEAEINSLLRQPGADPERVATLSKEIMELRSQLAQRYAVAGNHGGGWGWGGYGPCW